MSTDRTSDRRRFLKSLAVASVAGPLALGLARAQMGGHGGHDHDMNHDDHYMGQGNHADHGSMSMSSNALPDIGPDILPPIEIPWDTGTCAYCGMTVATPEGGANPPGFREKTYAQIRLAPGQELNGEHTLHFESLACMFNFAYSYNIIDGHGATFYVADLRKPPESSADLLLSRDASYLWAAGLSVSMAAHLGALPNAAALEMYVSHNHVGRHHRHSGAELADLAPIPEAGLLGLLNRHG